MRTLPMAEMDLHQPVVGPVVTSGQLEHPAGRCSMVWRHRFSGLAIKFHRPDIEIEFAQT